MRFGHTYPPYTNVLRGIVPDATVFDVNPTSLSNITDGDVSTATGTGTKNALGAGVYGALTFDMGAVRTVHVSGLFGLWSAANAVRAQVQFSDDNVTYTSYKTFTESRTNATELVLPSEVVLGRGRYIKIDFYVTGAANTANAKIYEVSAFEVHI